MGSPGAMSAARGFAVACAAALAASAGDLALLQVAHLAFFGLGAARARVAKR